MPPRPRKAAPPLQDNVGVRIQRLSEVFSRLARLGVEGPWGLRGADLRILNILDGEDAVAVSEIARRTHIDKAWISRSVRELEARGLVVRRADGADSRRTLAALTARGRALLDDIRPHVAAAEKRVLKGIDAPAFKRDLDRLLQNAEAILGEK